MSIRVALHHETRYRYHRRAALSPPLVFDLYDRSIGEYPEPAPHRPGEHPTTLDLRWP